MIKHLYKHQIKYEGVIYKPNGQGELYLPIRVEMCNPVDEEVVIKEPKKPKKVKVVKDEI